MPRFGKSSGGGRRSDDRTATATGAVFTTVTRSQPVFVPEVSCTGVRLEGENLPAVDEEIILSFGNLRAFCCVKWVEGNQCGIEFDFPLAKQDLAKLPQVHTASDIARRIFEHKEAYDDWAIGALR
jgi:hypothetical protein